MAIAFERASDKFLETPHRPSVRSNVGILAMLAGEGSTPTSGPDASRNPRRGVRDRSRGMGDHLGMQQHARRSWALSRLLALGLVGAACSAPARPAVPPAPAQPSVPPAPTPASGPLPITALVAGCQLQGGAVLCWGGRGCGGDVRVRPGFRRGIGFSARRQITRFTSLRGRMTEGGPRTKDPFRDSEPRFQ